MLELFFEFWRLNDPNVVWVLTGSVLLGSSAGAIGCFAFLRKRSLTGDALAHAALPGVTTAFLLFHSRDPLVLGAGALVSCFIGYFVIEHLIKRTIVKEDSAFAIVLSLFFAVGIFQLTRIQKTGIASQAGLDKMLFGQAAGMVRDDVKILGAVALGLLLFVILSFRQLKSISFDRQFSQTTGLPVAFFEMLLALSLVLSVVIGLQLVGVVLMAAVLLTPAAAARYWTNNLAAMVLISGIFGGLAGAFGANVSYLAPRMPTGPWMVMGVSAVFLISLLFAPDRGLLARIKRQNRLSRKVHEENILRTMYKIGENAGDFSIPVDTGTLLSYRNMALQQMEAALRRLRRKGLVEISEGRFTLTASGLERAKEVTRFHRLWELYLSKRIQIAPDHVHDEAEEIEHILTPDLEALLLQELGSPIEDPHGRVIPKAAAAEGEHK
ncbi:MAG: metal ABC transporter permease [Deltaproteobacteria bacterium]|nr:metal ABC transporter permease [Deltaproteobacteria bacterium]